MKEAWIYMKSQHLLTRKQEKPFKDTMTFKSKQCNGDINRKEMKAANRLCWRVNEDGALVERKLTLMDADSSYRQLLWSLSKGQSSQTVSREVINLFWEKGFQSHLGDCCICGLNVNRVLHSFPQLWIHGPHIQVRFCRSENERIWDLKNVRKNSRAMKQGVL